ncbi:MAG TPA: pilus assembly protein TadG-related protein [Candidatus Limnocylindrales bacterium]|nr:pilus assembly protein TadG-related protein [Candidatus Limnocylindrales bacterium]
MRISASITRRREAGQAIVVVALALVALLAILGLAVDIGYLRYEKRELQTAADAAAMAGAAELPYGDVSSGAKADSAANGFTDGANGATVTVNNPPLSGQHVGDSKYVEAIVGKTTPTFFAKAFGVSTVNLKARAVAHLGSGNNCIFALDPSASSALSVDGLASISSQCGIVVESAASNALSCSFFSSISASSIGVVGGVQSFLCGISPHPVTGIATPTPSDPLAYLPTPTVGSCTFSKQQVYTSTTSPPSKPTTINPGVYCGGISIQPGANVILNPGTYILTTKNSTGGLTVDVGSNVSTNTAVSPYGVMFYNYGPIGAITFNFTSFSSGNQVSLSAPTTGTYQGLLFFQDPQDTAAAQIIGSSSFNTSLEGSYYLPSASVVFAFSGNVKYDILVADKIRFAYLTFSKANFSASGFTNDYSSLASGSPVKGNGVLDE